MSLLDIAGLPTAKQQNDGSYLIRCPVPGHGQGKGDKNPSLHVWHDNEKDRMAAKCFAGCAFEDVKRELQKIGVWDKPKRQAQEEKEYRICDGAGKELAVHIRIDKPDGSKTFKWRPRGVKPESMLYGLQNLSKKPNAGVVLCEGEKAADAAQLAIPKAVVLGTVSGASSCPNAAVLKQLEGRIVVLWPDNDEMGLKHMRRVAQLLKGVAREIRVVNVGEIKPKGDAADLFKAEALKLVRSAPVYDPDQAPRPEKIRTFIDVEKEVLRTLDEFTTGNRQDVVPTGLRRLDAVLNGGWQKGAMSIIAAPSGAGKTSLVLQFADAASKALVVAPEMTVASLARRMLLRRAECSMREFKNEDRTRARVVAAVGEMLKAQVVFLDCLEPSMDEIREAALWMKPPLIVLDYAQFLTSMEDPKRYLALAKFAQFSIELAMETKAAVLMTSQVNVSKDGDYSLRESAMLNHKCHAQLDFYAPLPKNAAAPPKVRECHFFVAKQRDGISHVKIEGFMYEPAKYRVYEAEREEQDEPYWMR
jgi:archaellum biogenesis ATPase FlaH